VLGTADRLRTAQTAGSGQSLPVTAARKIVRFAGWVIFAGVMLLMAVLVFFLLQSRLTGGTPAVARIPAVHSFERQHEPRF